MLKIGADVEHGLYYGHGLVSAIGRIPGTKEEPYPLLNGGGLQVDNVLLEWNAPVADSKEEFVNAIMDTQYIIRDMYPEYTLGYDSSYEFNPDELTHPDAWVIGCSADFNAWVYKYTGDKDESVNPKPDFGAGNKRTAAGHIHVSSFSSLANGCKFIRLCDLYLGIPSLLVDNDTFRRSLYGKAGAFRNKKYPDGSRGVEYRVLGTWWTKRAESVRWVYDIVYHLYTNLHLLPEPPDYIQEVINDHNIHQAGVLINEYNLKLPY